MITLTPLQRAWLEGFVKDGPTSLCMDGVARVLLRHGLVQKVADDKLDATDKGRAVVRAIHHEPSPFVPA